MLTEKDSKIWSFLKLLLFVPKIQLRKRLIRIEQKLGEEESTRERYLSSKRVNIEIQREIRRLPKTKKFSGYIRSLSTRGKSQLGSGRIELPSTDAKDYIEQVDYDLLWDNLLSAPSLEDSFLNRKK